MNPDNEHIERLISRYLLGEASMDEQQEVDNWRSSSPENELHFEALQKTLDQTTEYLVGEGDKAQHIDIDKEWLRFQNATDKQSGIDQPKIVPLQSRLWVRIAASFILIAAIGFAVLQINKSRSITYYAEESGEIVELPDGTTVVMNENSELTYPGSFRENAKRQISLTGEAFFEVTHDSTRPFIVELEGALVQVLGTSFNIEAYENTSEIQVVVASGRVKLAAKDESKSVILNKGDRGTYLKNDNQVIQATNTDVNYLAWKTGKLEFEDSDLNTVIQTLNKLYNTNITISTASAENCRVTVSFDQQSLESILSVLEAALGLTYSKQVDTIEIVRTGC